MSDFTLIYGCMFAGKSTRLIEIYQDYQYDPSQKIVVKPLLDNRYNARGVSTHSGLSIPAQRVIKPEEISGLTTEMTKAVFIDEIQFFNVEILSTVNYLLSLGIEVYGAGLDRDYLGRDFGHMPALKALARHRIQVFARCFQCGAKADRTYRVIDSEDLILVGHSNVYEARCQSCWEAGLPK
ncbi:MAG: thymidine kinase [Bacteroidota bacterium]|jgi:thymidine kinase